MSEQLLFDQPGVKISRSLARFGDATYQINSIGSGSIKDIPTGKIGFGVILFLISVIFFIAALANGAFGFGFVALIVIVCSVMLMQRGGKDHVLVLRTSSGDQEVLRAKDRQHVQP